MFSFAGALIAYKNSLNNYAVEDISARIGARTLPIVGGVASRIMQIGNLIARPFKVSTGFLIGGIEAENIVMPELPENFHGKQLESAFKESWKLKMEENVAKTKALEELVSLNIPGYMQQSSVASFNHERDHNIVFAEERTARTI